MEGSKERRFPEIRLAHVPGAQGDNNLLGRNGIEKLPPEKYPGILISYVYLEKFLEKQSRYAYRDWMLDSGAFSAYNKGGSINIDLYMEICHILREQDESLVEIIALDTIGDRKSKAEIKRCGEGSLKNAIKMRDNGLDVIPVFHIGEDWEILNEYAKGWDKVGLSCRFGESVSVSMKFYEQCFARIWPKKCHSFGWVGEKMLMTFPFHSSDSADWEIKPCQFGTWRAFAGEGSTNYLNWKGSEQNLLVEIEWYLKLEERLRVRWKREMEVLASLPSKVLDLKRRGKMTTKG